MFEQLHHTLSSGTSRSASGIAVRVKVSVEHFQPLTRYRPGLLLVLYLAGVLASAMIVRAAERGNITGSVADPSGGAVAGARVVLRDASGAAAYERRTDVEGRFFFDGISEGRYRVTVDASGFTQASEVTVEVRPGANERISVRLEIAALSEQMVVTATRTATASTELADSVTVIGGEELKRENQSLVSESLRTVPGLYVGQTGGRGGITSIFARGGESDYNKVLIDGVPVNAAGGTFDFGSLTPENLDRIEVARGPNSALFGSDAMTSVIQLITRRGVTSEPELELSGEGGSFGFHREAGLLSGLAGRLDYAGSFAYQSTDGRFDNSDFINRSGSANLGFELDPDAELRVTARANNNTLGVPGPTAILFSDPDQRQKRHDISLGAALDLKTGSRWHQTARFIFSELETNSFDPTAQDLRQPGTPALPPGAFGDDFAFTFQDHQKRLGFQYQAIVAIGASNLLTGGVDFEHESAVFDDGFSRVAPRRNNLGLYIQDQVTAGDRLFITPGVRVERNTASVPDDLRAVLIGLGSPAPSGEVGFGVNINPKIATTFVARGHREGATVGLTRLKASFGTGIKEPKLDEAFSPSVFALGNPKLDPERATSFDVGVAQDFLNRRATVDATYFDGRFRDQIGFRFDPLTFGPIQLPDGTLTNFVNEGRASARGIELTAAVRPHLPLRIAGGYTFLRSRVEETGDPPSPEVGLISLRRPTHSGWIEASWVDRNFELALDGSFIGKRRDVDPVSGARFDSSGQPLFNDGYAKLNAVCSYRAGKMVTLFTRVENLLNQDYQEVLGYPAYRLNFTAGARFKIGGAR